MLFYKIGQSQRQESDFNKYDAKAFVFADLRGYCRVFKPLKKRGFAL